MNGMNAADVNNPMSGYYAEQTAAHAARNPHDAQAQLQAQYWANIVAHQRAAQAAQITQAFPTQTAGLSAPPSAPTPGVSNPQDMAAGH